MSVGTDRLLAASFEHLHICDDTISVNGCRLVLTVFMQALVCICASAMTRPLPTGAVPLSYINNVLSRLFDSVSLQDKSGFVSLSFLFIRTENASSLCLFYSSEQKMLCLSVFVIYLNKKCFGSLSFACVYSFMWVLLHGRVRACVFCVCLCCACQNKHS